MAVCLTRFWPRAIAVVALVLTLARPGSAQDPYDVSDGDVVFNDAMKLMAKGQYDQACALLERSLQLRYGMPTQFRLAQCFDKAGKTASAYKHYQQVLDKTREAQMADRIELVEKSIADLKPRLSSLQIAVSDDAAALPGFELRLDDKVLTQQQWTQAPLIDPGSHRVQATAPEHEEWQREVEVTAPGQTAVAVPMLNAVKPKTPPPPPPPPETSALVPAGIAIAGGGAVAMIVGGVLGIVAKGNYDDSEQYCLSGSSLCGDAEGIAIRDDARGLGTVGTVLFAVGGAVAIAGVVMWIAAPSADASKPADTAFIGVIPTIGGAQLTAGGTW